VFALTNLPPAVSKLVFAQQPGNTAVGQVIAPPVAVQVVDSTGLAVNASGIPVTLSLGSGTGALAGTLLQLTEANGRVTFGDLSIDQTGSKMLRATSPQQVPADSNTFQVTAGAPTTITVYGGSPQATTVDQLFPVPLQARVTDGAGNPLIGVPVTFSAPGGGPGGTFTGSPFVATAENGVATAPPLVANSVAGNFVATAAASGVGAPAQFALTNLPAQNAEIVVTPTNLSFIQELDKPAPAAQLVQAFSSLAFQVNWAATTSAPWLLAVPSRGITVGEILVTVNPTGLPAGTYTGTVNVATQLSVATVLVTYTITAKPSLVITPPSLVFQSTGVQAPASQTLHATSSARPIPYTVSTQVSSVARWLKVSPDSGQTVGIVTVTADPTGLPQGVYSGSVLFRPTESGLNSVAVPVTLVVGCAQGGCISQPQITTVVNGASFHPGGAPGAFMTLFGSGLADGVRESSTYPLPTVLGSTTVTVNGAAAPLFYVSTSRIDFQMPGAVVPQSGNVVVNNGAAGSRASLSYEVALANVSPGLFVTPDKRAQALNGDSTPHTAATPIPAGGDVSLFLTGQGAVTPPVPDGTAAPVSPYSIINGAVTVTIGTKSAQVTYKGLAPGRAAQAQVNAIVPAGLAPGDQPVYISIDGHPTNVGLITVK